VATFACLGLVMTASADTHKTKRYVSKPPPIQSDLELGFRNISRDQFLTTFKRVGMLPVQLPPMLGDRPDATRAIEDAIAKSLKLARFDVVPSQAYAAAFDRINHELGGMYDPKTGVLNRKVANVVAERARKEFIDAEKLDGLVSLRVMDVSASFRGGCITWHGVCDASDGGDVNDTQDSHRVGGMSGDVPALSLVLEVARSTGQVEYQKYAGIQPLAYVRVFEPGMKTTFLSPPVEDLLKDSARFERAAQVATLPFVHTAKDISEFNYKPEYDATKIKQSSLPPLPVARQPEDASPLLQPRETILQTVHRVALTRVYSGDIKVPDATQRQILDQVRRELAPLNWEIVDAPNTYGQLVSHMLEVSLFDPYTGRRNEQGLTDARRAVARSLGIKPVPDAILWVSVVNRSAMHREGDVVWDGVSQDAITLGPVTKHRIFFSLEPLRNVGQGSIQALSVQTYLADANDTPLYKSRGGIEVAQRIVQPRGNYYQSQVVEPIDLGPTDLFQHPERATTAVHIALRELVLTPEALAAELHPPDENENAKH